MTLLIYYVALIAVGTTGSILVGLWADRFSDHIGMSVFLVLYAVTLWISWIIAVRMTEPKAIESPTNAGIQPSRG